MSAKSLFLSASVLIAALTTGFLLGQMHGRRQSVLPTKAAFIATLSAMQKFRAGDEAAALKVMGSHEGTKTRSGFRRTLV